MHFCPKAVKTKNYYFITEEHEPLSLLDLDNTLNISGTSIPEVNNIKFNNQLSWIPHKDNLHKKLKSATGILKRICNNIPETHCKSLYYALFESHLSYCITVFGNVCKTHSEKLFTIRKYCTRILFGGTKKHTLISSEHLVAQDQSKLKFWAHHII